VWKLDLGLSSPWKFVLVLSVGTLSREREFGIIPTKRDAARARQSNIYHCYIYKISSSAGKARKSGRAVPPRIYPINSIPTSRSIQLEIAHFRSPKTSMSWICCKGRATEMDQQGRIDQDQHDTKMSNLAATTLNYSKSVCERNSGILRALLNGISFL
jgi:hypothetical protein